MRSSTVKAYSVTLNWTNPENSDYYYTLITYMNSEGEKVNKKVSKYSVDDSNKVSVIVGGFTDVNEHEFILTSFGYSGSSSSPVIIKGSPLGIEAAKDYVVNTVTAEPADEGAKLSWTNETSVGVNLIVSYVDKNEKKQIVTIDATRTGVYFVTGLLKETKLTVSAENHHDGGKSEEKVFMVTPTINPDDIVYPEVEYVTFQPSMNQMTITSSNPDNLYEYTIVTNGGIHILILMPRFQLYSYNYPGLEDVIVI